MRVVGLHPEELFDKLQEGELTAAEADRLRRHLNGCEVCRFEYAARLDFQEEALRLGASPPPALPLRPLAAPPSEGDRSSTPARAPRRRARRRLLVVGIAAAALISASAALAASITGRAPWPVIGALFSAAAPPKETKALRIAAREPSPAPPTSAAPSATPIDSTPTPSPSAEETAVVPPDPAPREHARWVPVAPSPSRAERASSPDSSPTQPSREADAPDPSSAAKLFGDANQARRSGDVRRASELYRKLQDRFGSSAEAELSRVTLALLQLDSGDARAALVGFERYLAGSSRGLEAEALVGRARALGRLGRRGLEIAAWQDVQRRYPRSIYGRQATERLAALGEP